MRWDSDRGTALTYLLAKLVEVTELFTTRRILYGNVPSWHRGSGLCLIRRLNKKRQSVSKEKWISYRYHTSLRGKPENATWRTNPLLASAAFSFAHRFPIVRGDLLVRWSRREKIFERKNGWRLSWAPSTNWAVLFGMLCMHSYSSRVTSMKYRWRTTA